MRFVYKNFPFLFFAVLCNCQSAEQRIASAASAAREKDAAKTALAPDGAAVFRKYCTTCHGADGKLGLNGAKDLSQSVLEPDARALLIRQGKGLMTPFGELLSPEEIQAVAAYTLTLKTQQ